MSSYTMYTSWKSARLGGGMMSRMATTCQGGTREEAEGWRGVLDTEGFCQPFMQLGESGSRGEHCEPCFVRRSFYILEPYVLMVHVPQELYLSQSSPRVHLVVECISHLLYSHLLLGLGVHCRAEREGGKKEGMKGAQAMEAG